MMLRRWIMRGLLFVVPIWLTITLVAFLYSITETWLGALTDQIVRWILPSSWLTGVFANGHIPGLSLITLLVLLGFVGFVASWHIGQRGLRLIDLFFLSIPGVKVLYSAIRKVIDSLGDPSGTRFQKVVFVKWGGIDTMGFVTGSSVSKKDGRTYSFVFVPTMPNPTSGFVVVVPEDETVDAGLSLEEGLKVVMSLGVLAPPSLMLEDKDSCGK